MISKLEGRFVAALAMTLVTIGCGGGTTPDPESGSGGSGATTSGAGGTDSGGTGGNSTAPNPCGEYALDLTDYEATAAVATPIATGEWTSVQGMFGLGGDLYVLGSDLSVIRGDSTAREVLGTDIPELSLRGYTDARRRLIVDAKHAYIATAAGISRIELESGSSGRCVAKVELTVLHLERRNLVAEQRHRVRARRRGCRPLMYIG